MLSAQKKHISFHTPGHKRFGDDITELPYSDNLFSPHGVILEAEQGVSALLKSASTFFLTDGSTAGVHAMLYALKREGARRIALSPYSHPCVKGGLHILGMEGVEFPARTQQGIPAQPTTGEMQEALKEADALFLTSPDYYGFFPDLAAARMLCDRFDKPLAIDGAHGSHLHFTKDYAGRYADLWVDGVHKSLPALTQGATVSCASPRFTDALAEGVRLFHTTSPSYPILASVEEAYLCPRNEEIERECERLKRETGAVRNDDWTKIVVPFGQFCGDAEKYLEAHGVYPEMNDGNYLLFYASPCTTTAQLKRLKKLLGELPRAEIEDELPVSGEISPRTELVCPEEAIGRTCAMECGIFPPSVPVIRRGERIQREAVRRLMKAAHTFGLSDGKITVYKEPN